MIVLDTHAWIWWISGPDQLSPRAREACDRAMEDRALCISSISVWEVALLSQRGRLRLTIAVEDWVRKAEALPFFRFIPVDNHIALRSVQLPEGAPRDPADRIIAATAWTLGAPLITKDRRLRRIRGLDTVW